MTATIVLEEEAVPEKRKGSYTKMDYTYLDDADFLSRVQIEWDQVQFDHSATNPRIRWEKAWKSIKQLFQKEKRRRKDRAEVESNMVIELQRLREELCRQLGPDLICRLATLEAAVWKRDRDNVIAWRRRSRVHWLTVGDAPSRYVFS